MNRNAVHLLAGMYEGFERLDISTRDGLTLHLYEFGSPQAPRVVIVNPIGVPIVIASRLARTLGRKYRVVCWEQRGYGARPGEFLAKSHDFSAFVSDLLDVVAQRAPTPAALIAVCSGAALAVRAVARNLLSVPRLVFISPAVRFENGYVPSIFDQAFVPYMRMISDGNERIARELLEMRAAAGAAPNGQVVSADGLIAEAADTASLESLETLTVYARTVRVFTDQRLDADIAGVRQEVCVLAAADDKTVSIKTVRQLCKLLPLAHLKEYDNGGHYMMFLREDVRDCICEVIDRAFPGDGGSDAG